MRHGIRIPPRFVPYLMLAPALGFIFAFILYPLGLNFYRPSASSQSRRKPIRRARQLPQDPADD
jgi:ABC-type sugar transport system permease subunit